MADAAHLTSAVSIDKPSIFEVIAQESLMTTIRPALKHAVRVLAENRPERFGWLARVYDEIYTVLDFIVQSHYLRKTCASFAENFYGLQRVPIGERSCSKLPGKIYWKSLICLVIFPYIKEKLDRKFEDMRHLYNSSGNKEGFSRLFQAFVALYPYVHAGWEATILGYQATYMFGKSDWHSPLLHLSGCRLYHSLEEDLWSGQQSSQIKWKEANLLIRIQYIFKYLFNMTAIAVSTGLSVGVFFLQFLDWWYTNDTGAASLTALPIPEPPKRDMEETHKKYGVCPICNRTRTNETALSVSGYVFCYPCIYDHVKKYSSCPITFYPARTEHLIRLYKDDA
ncbi:hypothetical protein CHS0354_014954 [Potamilus streckersoni]|uniref:Peroxisome assembly protein 12 n=1 Tax=Potamilus streckersoni TaxID=2493646 RepID=A0AAE0S857_9BIVA|nr:hypothetical protein CHS0354_014954 [Potamilus streckersoni]